MTWAALAVRQENPCKGLLVQKLSVQSKNSCYDSVESDTVTFSLGVRMKRGQRCSTIRYTVWWKNHGARTKTTGRRTSSRLQIPIFQPPDQQTETLIGPRCPPRATAPSPSLRPNLSLRLLSPCTPRRTRNQWCRHARKVGWHLTGLLCLPSPGRACRSPTTPETTERAPNSPANTDHQHDLASRSLKDSKESSFLRQWQYIVKLTRITYKTDDGALCFSAVHPEVLWSETKLQRLCSYLLCIIENFQTE